MNNYAAGDGRRFWIVGLQARAALAGAVPRGRTPRLVDRSAVRHRAGARRQRTVADRRTRRDLRDQDARRWAKAFAAEPDFFWSPINSLEDVVGDEQFHAAGGIVYVPDERRDRADGRLSRGLPRHTVGAAFDRAEARSSTPTRSSPNSGPVVLDARGVAKLRRGSLRRRRCAPDSATPPRAPPSTTARPRSGPVRQPFQPLPHQRNDPRQPLDDLRRFDVDHAQSRIGLLVVDDHPQRRIELLAAAGPRSPRPRRVRRTAAPTPTNASSRSRLDANQR